MGELNARVDTKKLLSFGDDLIGVLKNNRDGESLTASLEGEKSLRAALQADSHKARASLEEYHRRISVLKERIEETKREDIADALIEDLQHELDDKLQRESLLCQELRAIHEELDDLDYQRRSIEERKELVKKREKDLLRAEYLLSMCASVTNIIPNLDDQTMISGFVVERNKKRMEKFELDTSLAPCEVSNRLWKMVTSD